MALLSMNVDIQASDSSPALSGGSSFNPFAAAAQELESAHGSLFPSAAAGDGSGGGRVRVLPQACKWMRDGGCEAGVT